LYMFAHRDHGAFHEAVTTSIGWRLFEEMQPYWLRIAGFWNGRGGISIDIVWEAGQLPNGVKPLSIDNVKLYNNGH
jgi:7-cyano-7-deazaguanine reductase